MGDLLELIFALVAGFFWLFGGSLFKGREEDEPAQPTSSRQKNRRKDDPQSSDREARQREIRETILRKIAERRQQQSDSGPIVVLEPTSQYQEQHTEPQEEVSKPLVYAESVKGETGTGTSPWKAGDSAYGQEMQERLQEIEATKRQAEALKKKVKQQVFQDHYAQDQKRSVVEECILSVGSARTALKNPQNVRAAFVYSEILGKPVSLRNSSEVGRGI